MTSIEDRMVEGNKKYSSNYNSSGLALPPAQKATIVTCMDARVDPFAAFGLPLGDVNVVRTAGGCAPDALRSVLISNHILGTENVFIVKHTRCGLLGATNEMARGALKQNLGGDVGGKVDEYEFYPIADLEKSAREDVEWFRNHELMLKGVKVTGWILDIDTGEVRKVVE